MSPNVIIRPPCWRQSEVRNQYNKRRNDFEKVIAKHQYIIGYIIFVEGKERRNDFEKVIAKHQYIIGYNMYRIYVIHTYIRCIYTPKSKSHITRITCFPSRKNRLGWCVHQRRQSLGVDGLLMRFYWRGAESWSGACWAGWHCSS